MMKRPFTTTAVAIFSVMAIVHLMRLYYGWPVTVGELVIPMWASVLGVIVAAVLAIMVWRESR